MPNLLPERWDPLAQFAYFLRNFLRRFHTVCVRHVPQRERSIKRLLPRTSGTCVKAGERFP
jgi:hypothetical protein